MANETKMWLEGSKLYVSVNRLPEFRELLDQAKKEAQQLNQTIQKLSCFALEIDFSAGDIKRD